MQHRTTWLRAMSGADKKEALDGLFSGLPVTLTVDDVASVLNVSKQNVYLWLRDGVIPGYKIGTTWRVVRDELKETMREGANAPHKSKEE